MTAMRMTNPSSVEALLTPLAAPKIWRELVEMIA